MADEVTIMHGIVLLEWLQEYAVHRFSSSEDTFRSLNEDSDESRPTDSRSRAKALRRYKRTR